MEALTPLSVIFLLVLLAIKHFVCDGPLQTLPMVIGKATYGNGLGLLHAAIHGVGSVAVLMVAGVNPGLSIGLALAEMVVHYHIDFSKENLIIKMRWTTKDAEYWWALIGDQTLHQLTYLAMAAIVVVRS